MASIIKQGLLQTHLPNLLAKRYRGKINIQRPRQPHYERARLLAVTQPIYPKPELNVPCIEKQTKAKIKIENPYEKIIAKEVKNWFNHSQLITIFHLNSINADDMFKARVALHKQNMHLKAYGKSIMKLAIGDTKYEVILPLFESKNCIVFSPENKIQSLLKIVKKVPQMILLAGIVENRLLSKNELMQFASMPNITTVRAQMVGVLESVGGNLVNNLECHQKQLVTVLDAYVKEKEKVE